MFFSHNNSAGTVFFSQFQPKFRPANGASSLFHKKLYYTQISSAQYIFLLKLQNQKNKCQVIDNLLLDDAGSLYVASTASPFSFTSSWNLCHRQHYRTPWVCWAPETLGKWQKTLGKWFAECNTRRIALARKPTLPSAIYRALGKLFAVCCLALGEKKRS